MDRLLSSVIFGTVGLFVMLGETYGGKKNKISNTLRGLYTYYRRNLNSSAVEYGYDLIRLIVTINVSHPSKLSKLDDIVSVINQNASDSFTALKKGLADIRYLSRRITPDEVYTICWGIQTHYSFDVDGQLMQTLGVLGNVKNEKNHIYSNNLEHILRYCVLFMRFLCTQSDLKQTELYTFDNIKVDPPDRTKDVLHSDKVHGRPFHYKWYHPLVQEHLHSSTQLASYLVFSKLMQSCQYNIMSRLFVDVSLKKVKETLLSELDEIGDFENFIKNADDYSPSNYGDFKFQTIFIRPLYQHLSQFVEMSLLRNWKASVNNNYVHPAEGSSFTDVTKFYQYVFFLMRIACTTEGGLGKVQGLVLRDLHFPDIEISDLKVVLYWMIGRHLHYTKGKFTFFAQTPLERKTLYLAFVSTWDFLLYQLYHNDPDKLFRNNVFFQTILIMRWLMTTHRFMLCMWLLPFSDNLQNISALTNMFTLAQMCIEAGHYYLLFDIYTLYGDFHFPLQLPCDFHIYYNVRQTEKIKTVSILHAMFEEISHSLISPFSMASALGNVHMLKSVLLSLNYIQPENTDIRHIFYTDYNDVVFCDISGHMSQLDLAIEYFKASYFTSNLTTLEELSFILGKLDQLRTTCSALQYAIMVGGIISADRNGLIPQNMCSNEVPSNIKSFKDVQRIQVSSSLNTSRKILQKFLQDNLQSRKFIIDGYLDVLKLFLYDTVDVETTEDFLGAIKNQLRDTDFIGKAINTIPNWTNGHDNILNEDPFLPLTTKICESLYGLYGKGNRNSWTAHFKKIGRYLLGSDYILIGNATPDVYKQVHAQLQDVYVRTLDRVIPHTPGENRDEKLKRTFSLISTIIFMSLQRCITSKYGKNFAPTEEELLDVETEAEEEDVDMDRDSAFVALGAEIQPGAGRRDFIALEKDICERLDVIAKKAARDERLPQLTDIERAQFGDVEVSFFNPYPFKDRLKQTRYAVAVKMRHFHIENIKMMLEGLPPA